MDDLFTAFIVITAIISFLNKIFGKQKRGGKPQQHSKPDIFDFPWAQEQKAEDEPEWVEETLPVELERPWQVKEKSLQPVAEKTAPVIKQAETAPAIVNNYFEHESIQDSEIGTDQFEIDLSSSNELKRGIILAEILGPCRAKAPQKKFQ